MKMRMQMKDGLFGMALKTKGARITAYHITYRASNFRILETFHTVVLELNMNADGFTVLLLIVGNRESI